MLDPPSAHVGDAFKPPSADISLAPEATSLSSPGLIQPAARNDLEAQRRNAPAADALCRVAAAWRLRRREVLGLGGRKVEAVAFDVIGTVFPLEPLRPELVKLGLPPSGLEGWFAAGLRDAFALAAVGDFKPFAVVLEEALKVVAAEQGLQTSARDRAAVVAAMKDLAARSDAEAAFSSLHDHGIPVLALSNGSPALTKHLLDSAGLRKLVSHVVSVDEVKLSKPRPEVYLHAAKVAEVSERRLALVASHAWDVTGAASAGLVTGYLSADRPFSETMHPPNVSADTLLAVVTALIAR